MDKGWGEDLTPKNVVFYSYSTVSTKSIDLAIQKGKAAIYF